MQQGAEVAVLADDVEGAAAVTVDESPIELGDELAIVRAAAEA